jgi:integrase
VEAQQSQAILQAAAAHRLFPAFWLLATTGMRRSELLGLRLDDVDFKKARLSVNRGLVAVAYELHGSRGKTPNSRRAIDLDPTTLRVLTAWRDWQQAEQEAAGVEPEDWVFTGRTDNRSTHTRSPRPSNGSPPGRSTKDSPIWHPPHPHKSSRALAHGWCRAATQGSTSTLCGRNRRISDPSQAASTTGRRNPSAISHMGRMTNS